LGNAKVFKTDVLDANLTGADLTGTDLEYDDDEEFDESGTDLDAEHWGVEDSQNDDDDEFFERIVDDANLTGGDPPETDVERVDGDEIEES
jgi:uncharacterized protein YjbI with pentapeptide repeats